MSGCAIRRFAHNLSCFHPCSSHAEALFVRAQTLRSVPVLPLDSDFDLMRYADHFDEVKLVPDPCEDPKRKSSDTD